MAYTAAEMRALYETAEADILANGQSSAFTGRTLTLADLAEVRRARQEWERRALAEAQGESMIRTRIATVR